jgi:glucose/arabinose dehydrogenase
MGTIKRRHHSRHPARNDETHQGAFMRFSCALPALLSLAVISADASAALRKLPVSATPAAAKAIYPSELGNYQVDTIATGLVNAWAVALLPDGSFLVTERGGSLRRVSAAGAISAPLSGVPAVFASGQGGLLDLVLSSDFASDQRIYFSYAEAGANSTAGTAVARATLGESSIGDAQVIFRQEPKLSGSNHFGSRLTFAPDGKLFVTLGERFDRIRAQKLDMLQGKVVRINPDGSIPADNPFRTPKVKRAIWSFGHRNPQAAAIDPRTGRYWEGEHGPLGGDEINRPQAGRNYGWPLTSHGNDYATGQPYPEWIGLSAPGIEDPVRVWTGSSPALSGMAFLVGQPASAWNDNLFLGMLAYRRLVRLTLDGEQIVGEERLLGELDVRIRDVRAAADGKLYVLTDETNGRLLRITPPAAD